MHLTEMKMARRHKYASHEVSIADAISEAFGELISLAEEVREVCDNMPESLQQSSRYEALDGAASELENLNEPSVDDALGEIKVDIMRLVPGGRRGPSRNTRCGDAAMILDVIYEKLDEIACDEKNALHEVAEALRDEIDEAKAIAESIDFPGMYG